MYYYDCIKSEEYTYTCDMLRLKTYINSHDVIEIRRILNYDFELDFFTSHGFGKFPENWKADCLWIGLGAKTKNVDNNHIILCLEFNPNKMTSHDFEIITYLVNVFNFVVTRYDLAIDLPFNINQLFFSGLSKRSYSVYFNDFNNKTYYFGKGSGHTKIYNKGLESGLSYNLTRYEITIEDEFSFLYGSPALPTCEFISLARMPYYSLDCDDTLDAVLYAVNNGFPFKSLSRRYKDYIKKDIIGLSEIDINKCMFSLQNCLRILRAGFI